MINRIYPLDAFRGLAAMSVVLFHYSTHYADHPNFGFQNGRPFDFPWGYLGVPFFFMVSGFVIFMSMRRTKRPLDFVFSRLSRLYPTFWAGVLVTTLVVAATALPGAERTWGEILVNLTMFHEFFGVRAVDGVYWTLTVEMIFYGLMLGVLVSGYLHRIQRLLYAWLGIQLAALLLTKFGFWVPYRIEFFLLANFCHLFVAGIAFFKIHARENVESSYGLLAFALMNQLLLGKHGLADDIASVSNLTHNLTVVAFFFLFWVVIHGKLAFLATKPLLFLGSISFALYLVHQNVGFAIIQASERNHWPAMLGISAAITCSILVAYAITRGIEQPSARWLKRMYYPEPAQSTALPSTTVGPPHLKSADREREASLKRRSAITAAQSGEKYGGRNH